MPDPNPLPAEAVPTAAKAPGGLRVQLYGLLGVLIGAAVLTGIFFILRERLVDETVDAAQIAQYSDSACMRSGIAAATAGSKPLTYGELDRLKAQCGAGD